MYRESFQEESPDVYNYLRRVFIYVNHVIKCLTPLLSEKIVSMRRAGENGVIR